MPVGKMPRSFGTVAALLAALLAVLLAANGAVRAKDAAGKPPVAPPLSLDTSAPMLSPSALGADTGNFEKSTADQPDLKIPDSIKFGNNTLRFDTDRTSVDSIPRVGLDTTDRHVLPMPKDEDLPPTYFGLTLTTPTH
jgi:hypothetical protein